LLERLYPSDARSNFCPDFISGAPKKGIPNSKECKFNSRGPFAKAGVKVDFEYPMNGTLLKMLIRCP
jgi:hypothetical protein